ncbi:MAG: hypothetical protein OEY41_03485 [Acidimicrobiia bacterium]|nr:hypothetical protein [Acidimicrobiia bacterium]
MPARRAAPARPWRRAASRATTNIPAVVVGERMAQLLLIQPAATVASALVGAAGPRPNGAVP